MTTPSRRALEQVLRDLQRIYHGSFTNLVQGQLQLAESVWNFKQGATVIHTYGQAYPDEGEDDYSWSGLDSAGRQMLGKIKYADSQATDETAPELVVDPGPSATEADAARSKGCAETAADSCAEIEIRVAALRQWMIEDPGAASEFIANELSKEDLAEAWRNALVFAAEDVPFATQQSQDRICDTLRAIALDLRSSLRPEVEQVVWSALRRFGSLVNAESANQLVDFLTPSGYVDTRLVALRSAVGIFEHCPPDDSYAFAALADRAYDFAKKSLDPDVFTSGEVSAIASEAVLALCVLGDSRAVECIDQTKRLGRRWMVRKLRERLEVVRSTWAGESNCREDHPARLQVARILADLI